MTDFLKELVIAEAVGGVSGATAMSVLLELGATRFGYSRPGAVQWPGPKTTLGQSVLWHLLEGEAPSSTGISDTGPGGLSNQIDEEVKDVSIVIADHLEYEWKRGEIEEYRTEVARVNRSVWIEISSFGHFGSRANWRGSNLVTLASGGLLATIGGQDRHFAPKFDSPVEPGGELGLVTAGRIAALAALHGVDRFRETGNPVFVDVSAQEAIASTGSLHEIAHCLLNCHGGAGSARYVAPRGYFQCQDGLVFILALENHQWPGIVRALGSPAWSEDVRSRDDRVRLAPIINEAMSDWCLTRTKSECESLLQEQGVPATAVYGPRDILDSPQLKSRETLRSVHIGKKAAETVPAVPFSFTEAGSSSRGGRISGCVVADFSHVFAGPLAGSRLGAMGANVTHVEDLSRLDLYRRNGPFVDGIKGINRGAYFVVTNHSKTNVVFDSSQPSPRRELVEILEKSDVILENLGAHRRKSYPEMVKYVSGNGGQKLLVSLSGFGIGGPMGDYRAYGKNIHAAAGLTYLSRDHNCDEFDIGSTWGDPICGVTSATIIAAWALSESRDGGTVDLAMSEVVSSAFREYIAAESLDLVVPLRCGNARDERLINGIFATSDPQTLVAITVESDDALARLIAYLHIDLDVSRDVESLVEDAAKGHSPAELSDGLQAIGIACAPVWSAEQLATDKFLIERDFFPVVEQIEIGPRRVVALPWLFNSGQRPLIGPSPVVVEYEDQ